MAWPGHDHPTTTPALCAVCAGAPTGSITAGPRWRGLADAFWGAEAPTQIVAYRLLQAVAGEAWAADLLDSVYLKPTVPARAMAGGSAEVAVINPTAMVPFW